MAVSNPATFSSVRAEFGGSTKFSDYYRGGPYVPLNAAAGISTTAVGLALSQFNGVSKPSATLSATANSISGGSSQKGTFTIGTVTVTATGGNGTYTYGAPTLVSGADSGDFTTVFIGSQTGNQIVFKATAISFGGESVWGTWRCPVTSNGVTVYPTFNVNWN